MLTATVQAHPSVSLVAVSHVHTHELWLGPDGSLYGDDVTNVGERYRHRLWRLRPDGTLWLLEWSGSNDVHVCRLAPEGKGEAEPVADSETADGPALNRRVEVVRR